MSPLHSLVGHQVEAHGAAVAVPELEQRRVARRALGRLAELQDVLGGVLRVQLELVDGPLLHRPDADARREVALRGLLQVVDRRLDALATADVDAACRASARGPGPRRLASKGLLRLVDEDEVSASDVDARGGQSVVKFAQSGRGGQFRLKHPGPTRAPGRTR